MTISPVPSEWETPAEKSGYQQTPSYSETLVFCQRLATNSTAIKFETFGLSGQLRELPLLICSETGAFSAATAKEQGKAVVLIQACIHSGEPDGKDAGFALLRDIAITKSAAGLLQNVVLLFIPIYN